MKRCVLLSFAGVLACLLTTVSVARAQAADQPIVEAQSGKAGSRGHGQVCCRR
jgi:hypothetical protein